MDEFRKSCADWIVAGIEARGISVRQLAGRAGVDHSTISRLVRLQREPSHRTMLKLASVLDHDPTNAITLKSVLRRDPFLTPEDVRSILDEYHRRRRVRLHESGSASGGAERYGA